MSHLTDFDRAGRLTASQCAAAVGMCKFTSRAKLWRQITGKEPPFEGNAYTQYGNDNEANALTTLEANLGVFIDKARFRIHPEISWLGASPDGLIGSAIVEVKCPQTLHVDIPEYYRIQMLVQMACYGTDTGYFASWTPDAMMVKQVAFDKQFWDEYLLPGMDRFWNHYVAKDIEPPRGKFNIKELA